MRTLLSKKESAQLIILEVLLEKQKISLDDLAKVSLISKQTLCNYLDELLIKLPFLQIKKKNNEIRLLKTQLSATLLFILIFILVPTILHF